MSISRKREMLKNREACMDSGSIGIELAGNKYFPIMDDGVRGMRTLAITTASDNQESMQIHLYRSKESRPSQSIYNAEYIGTLIIEGIAKKPAGAPAIKLKIALGGSGDLSAEARDAETGARQRLNVFLKELPRETRRALPDFSLTGVESAKGAPGGDFAGIPAEAIAPAAGGFSSRLPKPAHSGPAPDSASADAREAERLNEKSREIVPAWLCMLILAAGIALLAAGILFAWRLFSNGAEARRALASSPPAFVSTGSASSRTGIASTESASSRTGIASAESASSRPPRTSAESASSRTGIASAESASSRTGIASAESASSRTGALQQANVRREPEPAATQRPSASAPAPSSSQDAPAQEPAPPAIEEPTPPPVWQDDEAAVVLAELEPPKPPAPAPATQDVHYTVKPGDTLWDLAETFYRDPWRFSDIARHNSIRNPSLIVVGMLLIIPAE